MKSPDPSTDMPLKMAKGQGYVPEGCVMHGPMVMTLVNEGKDPCKGCNNDRGECKGRSK